MASRQRPVLRRLRGADGFRSRRDAMDQASCAVHLSGPSRVRRGTACAAPVHLGRHLAVRPCSLERR